MLIDDGKGKNGKAGVNTDQELLVRATTRPEAKLASTKGEAFTMTTDKVVVGTASPNHLLYIRNTSDVPFIIDKALYSWDGGTGGNDSCQAHLHINPSAPTANNTVLEPNNLNLGFPDNANLAVEKWDGVGAGMTIATAGAKSIVNLIGLQGRDVDFSGALELKNGNSLSFMLIGDTAGNGSITIFGHFQLEE